MEAEKTPYWRRYDWDGDGDVDDKDAVVCLSHHLLIRLTDPDNNPVPKAKCRIIGDTTTVYECDNDGVARIPVSDWSLKGIDLEWETSDAEAAAPSNRYYWKNSFDLDVCDRNDPAISHRFTNLGFTGAMLAEQINAYQTYFGSASANGIDAIKTQMADWHDGGTYPGQVLEETNSSTDTRLGTNGAPSTSIGSDVTLNSDAPVEYVDICLLNTDKKAMSGAKCKQLDGPDPEMVYIADGDGIVHIPLTISTETIEIVWESNNSDTEENGPRFYLQQTIHIPFEGEDTESTQSKMLSNLGFDGQISEQKTAYEQFFNEILGNSVDSIHEVLAQWVNKEPLTGSAIV